MASIPPDFPLPQVHAALTAFIANKPTTREKRQVLTSHIQSIAQKISTSKPLQDDEEAFNKYLDTQLGRPGSYVNRQWEKGKGAKGRFGFGKETAHLPVEESRELPPLLPGPRREYLLALRENILAKREYEAAVSALQADSDNSDSDMSEAEDDPSTLDTAFISTYTTVERLKILLNSLLYIRDYLSDLTSRLSTQPPTPIEPPRLNISRPPSMPSTRTSITPSHRDPDQSTALFPLRKAIHTTATHISHLESLPPPPPPQPGPPDILHALEKTRSQLQSWIEQTLPLYEDTAMPTLTPAELEDLSNARAGLASKIQDRYTEYLSARTRVVSLLDAFLSLPPLPTPEDVTFTPSSQPARPSTPPRSAFPIPSQADQEALFPHLQILVSELPTLIATHKSLLTTRTALSSTLQTTTSSLRTLLTSLAIDNNVPGVAPVHQSRYGGAEDEFAGQQDAVDVAGRWVEQSSKVAAERERRIRETALEGRRIAERVEGLVGETREMVVGHQGGWGQLGGGVGVIGEI
ncbi:hypothetical protein BJ508DRAFT_410771 [Ascobolus immersus RN42]|uniref:Uncharacterized protein n=1 Tax=Ascobolus immersus RN42 TaxID=1160509 RepID=A0A3N4IR74_ASCIM|nr:hypothetical protein BJ508DRAFT_410771 [Ascobolus immersus RN42]